MVRLSIRSSDEVCKAEVKDAAVACLRRHTERSNGVLMQEKPFSVFAFQDEQIVGGLIGRIIYNWIYVEIVWVEEEFRGRGIGTDVMKAAEERAREMKLTGMYLWTESWQGPAFYAKLGYTQFVEFRNFPPGHSRLGFCKYFE